MITKEIFRKEAKLNVLDQEFVFQTYSKIFDKEIEFKVAPENPDEVDENDGITNKIIKIINDVISLDASNLALIKETVWKCFNRYSNTVIYTINADDECFKNGEITKEEYDLLNRKRQQNLFKIYNEEDCWNKIGEPEYRTCMFPRIWNHRFGLITFYPEWEENGLNILIRNGKIIGYNNGIDPIIKEFDNPKLKSVYELWS